MFGFQDLELAKTIEFFFLGRDEMSGVRTIESRYHFCELIRRVKLAYLENAAALVLAEIMLVRNSEEGSASVMVEVGKKAV